MLPNLPKTLLPVARGIALFLALFTLLNLIGDLLSPGFDSNIWWIDLAILPHPLAQLALTSAALALLAFALAPRRLIASALPRRLIQIAVLFLLLITVLNSLTFYILLARRLIHAALPFPLSLLLALSLALILLTTFAPQNTTRNAGDSPSPKSKIENQNSKIVIALSFLASLALFPLAQMYCFGKTDYRRHADAIVVFGALAHPDGTPSDALADRVRTALDLYHAGYAPTLIFTGGPSQGPLSEPQVMRNLALADGVPDSAILLNNQGLHTDASVAHTLALARAHHFHTLLAVSHFYHLPRIKMSYARALATAPPDSTTLSSQSKIENQKSKIELFTVPAHESRPLYALPRFLAREILALYAYYLRPLTNH